MQVDKGIPVPTTDMRAEATRKYPFNTMDVGDSFYIETFDMSRKVQQAARLYGKQYGMKFTIRKVADGFRCWRIA